MWFSATLSGLLFSLPSFSYARFKGGYASICGNFRLQARQWRSRDGNRMNWAGNGNTRLWVLIVIESVSYANAQKITEFGVWNASEKSCQKLDWRPSTSRPKQPIILTRQNSICLLESRLVAHNQGDDTTFKFNKSKNKLLWEIICYGRLEIGNGMTK
jgi:hypothetical protein